MQKGFNMLRKEFLRQRLVIIPIEKFHMIHSAAEFLSAVSRLIVFQGAFPAKELHCFGMLFSLILNPRVLRGDKNIEPLSL